ncbi:multiubiquitin domain-containing protein [Spirosoma sp.]|uniref:multiubiquitin domain-containing protein n=1 Tax=Spirosoma sp. TaxID=1899569 RepID=UPI003B3B0AED
MSQTNNSLAPVEPKSPFLEYIVEGKSFNSKEQYVTGQQIKLGAGIPLDTELYLSVAKPWVDELIMNDARVNLARPEIEYFYVRKKLDLSINGVDHIWFKQYISLEEIKELGQIDDEDEVYLKIAPPFEDELIRPGVIVNLARPSKEHFFSKEKAEYTLIVNATPKRWTQKTISYEQVIVLAFGQNNNNGQMEYTVAYSKGPKQNHKGSMDVGSVVKVKNEMQFNATATDKS